MATGIEKQVCDWWGCEEQGVIPYCGTCLFKNKADALLCRKHYEKAISTGSGKKEIK